MGTIGQGILGGFSGKVGNVVGGNWKGIDYMRVKPASVANPKTEGQMDQRSKFTKVLQFLQPMKDYIKIGYQSYAVKMTEFNSAMSYLLKNAVAGEYPDFTIDYQNALLSKGALASSLNGVVNSPTAGTVSFTWDDNSNDGNAEKKDKAMVLVFNETRTEAVFVTDGANRNSGAQSLTVPTNYSGDVLHAFIAFVSEDGKKVSDSNYLGIVGGSD
ncbi:DUF6266 family protein [uncultured Draconibacterium sp.]|uniref:DUF6266 family protein n=1 Tax=uncultured Draconibacterium sp. TaxID=1573823 RepID=UPI0029C8752C|nr:DUF6266 family protein [uncultured Draconibacterium sp.]